MARIPRDNLSIRVTFDGFDEFISQYSAKGQDRVLRELDNKMPEYAKQLAKDMSDRAPVDTGNLEKQLLNSPKRAGFLHMQLEVPFDQVPYVYRQSREHATMGGYIEIPAMRAIDGFPEWIKQQGRGIT